jgi:hypothetical protein
VFQDVVGVGEAEKPAQERGLLDVEKPEEAWTFGEE